MIVLDATTRKLQVVLGGAITTNQLDWTVDWIDLLDTDQSVSDVGHSNGATNSMTAVDMVAAPAASHTRQIKSITVHNRDTADATITIRYNDNGTTYTVIKMTIATLETLVYGG